MAVISAPEIPAKIFERFASQTNAPRYVREALNCYAAQDYEGALMAWDEAIAASQGDGMLHLGRGLVLLNLGRFAEALSELERAKELMVPDDMKANLHSSRAIAIYGIGQKKEALAELDASIQASSDRDVLKLRAAVLNELLKDLASTGFANWSGRKPRPRKNPVKLAPGPSIAELVREGRR